jgi:hypothetical protein
MLQSVTGRRSDGQQLQLRPIRFRASHRQGVGRRCRLSSPTRPGRAGPVGVPQTGRAQVLANAIPRTGLRSSRSPIDPVDRPGTCVRRRRSSSSGQGQDQALGWYVNDVPSVLLRSMTDSPKFRSGTYARAARDVVSTERARQRRATKRFPGRSLQATHLPLAPRLDIQSLGRPGRP